MVERGRTILPRSGFVHLATISFLGNVKISKTYWYSADHNEVILQPLFPNLFMDVLFSQLRVKQGLDPFLYLHCFINNIFNEFRDT